MLLAGFQCGEEQFVECCFTADKQQDSETLRKRRNRTRKRAAKREEERKKRRTEEGQAEPAARYRVERALGRVETDQIS